MCMVVKVAKAFWLTTSFHSTTTALQAALAVRFTAWPLILFFSFIDFGTADRVGSFFKTFGGPGILQLLGAFHKKTFSLHQHER